MHETTPCYKSDSVSKNNKPQKHFFMRVAFEIKYRAKLSHKIVFKGTSKAMGRHYKFGGTNYHSAQQSLSQAIFFKIAFFLFKYYIIAQA